MYIDSARKLMWRSEPDDALSDSGVIPILTEALPKSCNGLQ